MKANRNLHVRGCIPNNLHTWKPVAHITIDVSSRHVDRKTKE